MTRVTAPIGTLTRSLVTHPTVARPAYLAGARRAHNAAAPVRTEGEENRRFTMAHRPTPSPTPSPGRTVPLMQTFAFRTTAPAAAQVDDAASSSHLDCVVMPLLGDEAAAELERPSHRLRVPLLPDNFFPARDQLDGHAPEAADGPLAAPQIVVVAAHPENVAHAAALTEIEGVGLDGVELQFAHRLDELVGGGGVAIPKVSFVDASAAAPSAPTSTTADAAPAAESGMLRDLWKGLLDDLTPQSSAPATKTP